MLHEREEAGQSHRLCPRLDYRGSEPMGRLEGLNQVILVLPPSPASSLGELDRVLIGASKRNLYHGKPQAASVAEELAEEESKR